MCDLIDCLLNPENMRKINFKLRKCFLREKEAERSAYVLGLFTYIISFAPCIDSVGKM